jgi:uncharacterized protein CbrC (UPF0167 family)
VAGEMAQYGWSAGELETFLHSLSPDGAATAYLFRCRHCRAHLAYADFA